MVLPWHIVKRLVMDANRLADFFPESAFGMFDDIYSDNWAQTEDGGYVLETEDEKFTIEPSGTWKIHGR